MDVRKWLLTSEERDNPHTRIDQSREDGVVCTAGSTVRAIRHGRTYFEELHTCVTTVSGRHHDGRPAAGDAPA